MNHVIQVGGVVVFVSRIGTVMVGHITHHVIPIIGDILKINVAGYGFFCLTFCFVHIILQGLIIE